MLRGGSPQRQTGDHQTQQNHQYAEDDRKIARSHAGRGADIQRLAVDKEACANGHDNQAAEDSLGFCISVTAASCLLFRTADWLGKRASSLKRGEGGRASSSAAPLFRRRMRLNLKSRSGESGTMSRWFGTPSRPSALVSPGVRLPDNSSASVGDGVRSTGTANLGHITSGCPRPALSRQDREASKIACSGKLAAR